MYAHGQLTARLKSNSHLAILRFGGGDVAPARICGIFPGHISEIEEQLVPVIFRDELTFHSIHRKMHFAGKMAIAHIADHVLDLDHPG